MEKEKLIDASAIAKESLKELRDLSSNFEELVKPQNFVQTLSYFWTFFQLSRMREFEEHGKSTQLTHDECTQALVMQYIHALHSEIGFSEKIDNNFDEDIAGSLSKKISLIRDATQKYIMYSTMSLRDQEHAQLKMKILFNWAFVRGRRYSVIEKEFFDFVLLPQDRLFREGFDISSSEVADEFHKLARLLVEGLAKTQEVIVKFKDKCFLPDGTIDPSKLSDPSEKNLLTSAMDDFLFAGVFNASKHSKLPVKLLDAISFKPGSSDEFLKGEFAGTPLNTFPSSIKPLIKQGESYYHTDPNSLCDFGYRALERAVKGISPNNKEAWNIAQASMCEEALVRFGQFKGDTVQVWKNAFYKSLDGRWCEIDLIIRVDDVLLVCEAKGGGYSLRPPGVNIEAHIKSLGRTISEACRQAFRFIDAFDVTDELQIFKKHGKKYEVLTILRQTDIGQVVPVGISVESLAPHTSLVQYENIDSLSERGFVFLAVEDLIVLNKFLPKLGSFLHYLLVRLAMSKKKFVSVYDEMDQLGLYLRHNRIDIVADEHQNAESVDFMTFDGYDEVVGDVMMHEDYPDCTFPHRKFPKRLSWLLDVIDEFRPNGWRFLDTYIRDLNLAGAEDVSDNIDRIISNVKNKPYSFGVHYGPLPIIIVVVDAYGFADADFALFIARSCLLKLKIPTGKLLFLSMKTEYHWNALGCTDVRRPTVVEVDYNACREFADGLEQD